MARLIALVCLVTCLMAALVATVSAGSERTNKQWKNLAMDHFRTFSDTEKANEMSPEDVVSLFEEFKEAIKHSGDLMLLDESWDHVLNLRENLLNCDGQAMSTVYKMAAKKAILPWQFNYALDCLRERFEKCGQEAVYKQAVATTKGAGLNLDKYPTLDSYFRAELWQLTFKNTESCRLAFEWTLEVLAGIVELDNNDITCNVESVSSRLLQLERLRQSYPQLYKLTEYQCQNYLRKCGYEDQYQKAIGRKTNGEWDSDKYPTLYSYLLGEFHSKKGNDLELTLSIFKDFSEFGSTLDESQHANCRKDQTLKGKMAVSLGHTRNRFSQLHKLAKGYFELYLHECGYEERFKRAMTEHGLDTDEGESPFASYIWGEFSDTFDRKGHYQDFGSEITFALWAVDNMLDSDEREKLFCDGSTTSILAKQMDEAIGKKHAKLTKCLSEAFADYLKVCFDDFKARANRLEQENNEPLAYIKELAGRVEAEIMLNHKNDRRASRQIYEVILPVADVKKDLKSNCALLVKQMGPTIQALSYDFCPVTQDDEVKAFMNYLGYCHSRKVDQGIDKTILNMFEKLGAPYYPTRAAAPVVKEKQCRKYN